MSFSAKILKTEVLSKVPGRYLAWPTVVRCKNGELLVVFSGDRLYHACPYGKTMLMRSCDDGDSWSTPEVITNTPLDDRDAGILETDKGTLLVSHFTSLAFENVEAMKWVWTVRPWVKKNWLRARTTPP